MARVRREAEAVGEGARREAERQAHTLLSVLNTNASLTQANAALAATVKLKFGDGDSTEAVQQLNSIGEN